MSKTHRTDAYVTELAAKLSIRAMPDSIYDDPEKLEWFLTKISDEQHGLRKERNRKIIQAHDTPPEDHNAEQRMIVAFASRPESEEPQYNRVTFYPDQRFECRECGRYAIGEARIKYCCNQCREKSIIAQRTPYQPRPKADRQCSQCGDTFTPARADARFCSGKCRVAAHRANRTAA